MKTLLGWGAVLVVAVAFAAAAHPAHVTTVRTAAAAQVRVWLLR